MSAPMDLRQSIAKYRALASEMLALGDTLKGLADAVHLGRVGPMDDDNFERLITDIRHLRQQVAALIAAVRDRSEEVELVRRETEGMTEATRQKIERAGLSEAERENAGAEAGRALDRMRLPPADTHLPPTDTRS